MDRRSWVRSFVRNLSVAYAVGRLRTEVGSCGGPAHTGIVASKRPPALRASTRECGYYGIVHLLRRCSGSTSRSWESVWHMATARARSGRHRAPRPAPYRLRHECGTPALPWVRPCNPGHYERGSEPRDRNYIVTINFRALSADFRRFPAEDGGECNRLSAYGGHEPSWREDLDPPPPVEELAADSPLALPLQFRSESFQPRWND
jgi:hypothetical protein